MPLMNAEYLKKPCFHMKARVFVLKTSKFFLFFKLCLNDAILIDRIFAPPAETLRACAASFLK